MTNDSTAVDFGINLLEEEIDDVIFRTNEFLTDATFTGGKRIRDAALSIFFYLFTFAA